VQSVVGVLLHNRLRFPTQEPVYGAHAPCLSGATSPEIKQLMCEASHSPLPNAQNKNGPTRQRLSKAVGFVRCNIAKNNSVSLYPTLCTLVLGGSGYLLLGITLKQSFGKSFYWILRKKKNIQILLFTSYENNTQKRQLECNHKFKTSITTVKD
jgi:hypothetical protein